MMDSSFSYPGIYLSKSLDYNYIANTYLPNLDKLYLWKQSNIFAS